ncbi:putative hydrolase of the HAD superfamily [Rhodovulum imhoffii]|uniref:Putative hydrolase of the HAD superfamily n=1 Tax=Rhodovulum imhoffii TaxID=365340 RepID=A0A2T5BQN3_9RHOB|nr:pyrimidine 5'-nucleotidase [Rhodovulum imhoffii]MBK5933913.1 pyrimidine 5'-nucleotidase [Rhodovulum imhoffii]PTN01499.1 putative hydrolase of the HAD superfamily [Rhodovulum imhoffii]
MSAAAFSHVTGWVFDLDNTLYPPEARLFDQIEQRMTRFVMTALGIDASAANRLRQTYWARYGTTLAGLMDLHGVDPAPYLHEVHDISLDSLMPDPALRVRIGALPGRRIVYTNGSAEYAERVLAARGLAGLFDAVYGVEQANYRPKPERAAFEAVFETDGLRPETAAMFEDDARNLAAPHAMGMRTVHVSEQPRDAPHIHFHTRDLKAFLGRLQD